MPRSRGESRPCPGGAATWEDSWVRRLALRRAHAPAGSRQLHLLCLVPAAAGDTDNFALEFPGSLPMKDLHEYPQMSSIIKIRCRCLLKALHNFYNRCSSYIFPSPGY